MTDTSSKGTVRRGADGSLYYISDDKMQSFKLPDEQTADARKALDDAGMKAQAALRPGPAWRRLGQERSGDGAVLICQ